MSADEPNDSGVDIDEDEIDRAEIEEIRQHAPHPDAPRSILHFFDAHDRQSAQRLVDLLNAKYEASGGAASLTGVDIDLTDPETAPYQVAFEHEAVVNDGYLAAVRAIEALADSVGVEYGGWQADEE